MTQCRRCMRKARRTTNVRIGWGPNLVIPLTGIALAAWSLFWSADDPRIRVGFGIGVLVLTAHAMRWWTHYSRLFWQALADSSKSKSYSPLGRVDYALHWLFRRPPEHDHHGSQNDPLHIKMDGFDLRELSGEAHRTNERLRLKYIARPPAEVPAWWWRRIKQPSH